LDSSKRNLSTTSAYWVVSTRDLRLSEYVLLPIVGGKVEAVIGRDVEGNDDDNRYDEIY
jgi:hypothetical protein